MIDQSSQNGVVGGRERAILIGAAVYPNTREIEEEHLDELAFLAETAGAHAVERVLQVLSKKDPGWFIGKGKVEEVAELIEEDPDITLVIVDDDLSPVQLRNLENRFERKVVDRSGLILDIFASRARTAEARTQVELAQLLYLMPRLTRMWTHLSKQYGGIGTKGPGETQIETDRRIIKSRISKLRSKLDKISTQRRTQRKGREESYRVALVGYTNAGKSTLMNELSGRKLVRAENKLFATLDTTVRSVELKSGIPILLSDTVGFIRKLPPNLIASFRSTLAEARESDLLLHVIDSASPTLHENVNVVDETLKEIGAGDIPRILVFNKIDLVDADSERMLQIRGFEGDVEMVSAEKGLGLQTLIDDIAERVESTYRERIVKVEMSQWHNVERLREWVNFMEEKFNGQYGWVRMRYSPKSKDHVEHFLAEAEAEDVNEMPEIESVS